MQASLPVAIATILSAANLAGADPAETPAPVPEEPATRPPAAARLPPEGVATPMDLSLGKPAIAVTLDGKGPFRLLVDTGAGPVLILNDDLVAELGLPSSGVGRVGDPADPEAIEVSLHPVATVAIGDAVFSDVVAMAWDRGTLYAGKDAPRGVVGLPMFRDVLVTFDYPGNALRLAPGALEAGPHVVDYTAPLGVPQIPVVIGERTLDAHLDSGSMAALTLPLSMQDDVALASPLQEIGRARTVNSEFAVYAADYRGAVSIAGHPLQVESLGFMEILPNANVGSEALRNFAVTFDQRRLRARFDLAPGTTAKVEKPRGGLGLKLGMRGDTYEVAGTVPGSPAAAADLRAGDLLVAVNGHAVAELAPGDFAVEMRKPVVALTIERGSERREVTLRR